MNVPFKLQQQQNVSEAQVFLPSSQMHPGVTTALLQAEDFSLNSFDDTLSLLRRARRRHALTKNLVLEAKTGNVQIPE